MRKIKKGQPVLPKWVFLETHLCGYYGTYCCIRGVWSRAFRRETG